MSKCYVFFQGLADALYLLFNSVHMVEYWVSFFPCLLLPGNHSAFTRFPVTLSSSLSSTFCFNNSAHRKSFINIKISLPLTLDQDVIENYLQAYAKKIKNDTQVQKNNYSGCKYKYTHTAFLERTCEVSICILMLINGRIHNELFTPINILWL